MRYILRTLSAIGLISLSVNAWADASGGFNGILQAASGPATSAGQTPTKGTAIKGLPANLGGAKTLAPAATTTSGKTPLAHSVAPARSSPPLVSSQPAPHPSTAPVPAAVTPPTVMAQSTKRPIGAPMSAQPPRAQQGMTRNVPANVASALPASSPLRQPSPTPNPAATGYINPFVGQPGVIEKLSNQLSAIKLKNEIAKAQATGAKYRTEYATLSQNNSPQMQALAQSVNQMKARLAQLKTRKTTTQVRVARAAQRKKAKSPLVLVGILHNDGDKYALLQVGKHLLTLSKGAKAGSNTIQSIGTDSIKLTNGDQLRVSPNGVGRYAATSWKGTQAGGGITPPQSPVSAGLMNQARQAGIPLPGATPPPGAGGQAQANPGSQTVRFPTPGMQP
jgi:hypothetical protein